MSDSAGSRDVDDGNDDGDNLDNEGEDNDIGARDTDNMVMM